ncbi:phosphotransferase [Klebsiella pneumoniae]|nr:phosphotransferase [Klebsiella pneumoniae]
MNLRQQQQQAFDRSGEPLIVGNVSHCPLPPETLAALGPDSPYVVQVYGSGLTGEVYRLRIAGKEYNLKKRRAVAGVANLNGQLSFLNEVQRRQALQQLKDDPVTAPRFTHIVPTLYADYRLGILLSRQALQQKDDPVTAPRFTHIVPTLYADYRLGIHRRRADLTPPLIAQLFTTLEACEEQGLMEWDLCSGNLLVDRQEQLWLFDFGYMYPFDPLREFNSNGLADPLFHFVERFETRFFFSWLMTRIPDAEQQLAQYREMKRLAVESYRRKLVWLRARRADPQVLAHFQQLTARWESALADPAALSRLFAVEAFRSHVLDIEDDLHGQSCTLLTLQRIDWVINQLEQHYRFIADEGGLFYDNEGKSQQALLSSYAQKRQQAQQYLLNAAAAKD